MKNKKLLLTVGAISTTAVSMMAVVSCSFETKEKRDLNNAINNPPSGAGLGNLGNGGSTGTTNGWTPTGDAAAKGDVDAGKRLLASKSATASMPQSAKDLVAEGIKAHKDVAVGQIVNMVYNTSDHKTRATMSKSKSVDLADIFKATWTKGIIKKANPKENVKAYKAMVNGKTILFEGYINYDGHENSIPAFWIDGEVTNMSSDKNPTFEVSNW